MSELDYYLSKLPNNGNKGDLMDILNKFGAPAHLKEMVDKMPEIDRMTTQGIDVAFHETIEKEGL